MLCWIHWGAVDLSATDRLVRWRRVSALSTPFHRSQTWPPATSFTSFREHPIFSRAIAILSWEHGFQVRSGPQLHNAVAVALVCFCLSQFWRHLVVHVTKNKGGSTTANARGNFGLNQPTSVSSRTQVNVKRSGSNNSEGIESFPVVPVSVPTEEIGNWHGRSSRDERTRNLWKIRVISSSKTTSAAPPCGELGTWSNGF